MFLYAKKINDLKHYNLVKLYEEYYKSSKILLMVEVTYGRLSIFKVSIKTYILGVLSKRRVNLKCPFYRLNVEDNGLTISLTFFINEDKSFHR